MNDSKRGRSQHGSISNLGCEDEMSLQLMILPVDSKKGSTVGLVDQAHRDQ